MDKNEILNIKNRILNGGNITRSEALRLINTPHQTYFYEAANEIREQLLGNQFDLCSIENAKSGACSEDCKWCSQSAHNDAKVDIYEMVDTNVAIKTAVNNENKGVKRYSLVTSGRAVSNKNIQRLCLTYKAIRKHSDIKLCASMGLLNRTQLEDLKAVGVEHYHCNLESSRRFFPEVCSSHTYDEKIATLKMAQELGIAVCSGGIIGLGETVEDRVDLAFELADLNVFSIPINILNPIEGTPLSGNASLSKQEILGAFAIFRFINPKAKIRLAGGRGVMKPYQEEALRTGINAALVGDLLTTTGSSGIEEDINTFKSMGFDVES